MHNAIGSLGSVNMDVGSVVVDVGSVDVVSVDVVDVDVVDVDVGSVTDADLHPDADVAMVPVRSVSEAQI